MFVIKYFKILIFLSISSFFFSACNGIPGGDARKFPDDPELRVKKNLEEGRGFRLNDQFSKDRGGVFDFATSNELWRATLETLDFIPLSTADYGGGIIITDWYNNTSETKESLKISVRFLTNEIRSDALLVKIFKKNCLTIQNCKVLPVNNDLNAEIKLAILKKATLFKNNKPTKPYVLNDGDNQ